MVACLGSKLFVQITLLPWSTLRGLLSETIFVLDNWFEFVKLFATLKFAIFLSSAKSVKSNPHSFKAACIRSSDISGKNK